MTKKDKQKRGRGNEQGVAMILAILFLLLVSTLAAGMIFMAQTEVIAASSHRKVTQAVYVAEAGTQSAMEWLSYEYPKFGLDPALFNMDCYPVVLAGQNCGSDPVLLAGLDDSKPNFPDSTVEDAFAKAFAGMEIESGRVRGRYFVDARLLAMRTVNLGMFPPYAVGTKERWELTVQGRVNPEVQESAVVERFFRSYFAHALYGICSVARVAGNGLTDSYNSDNGAYGGSNVFKTGAGVGSNGGVTTEGSVAFIGGDVNIGPGNGADCPAGSPTSVNAAVVNGVVEPAPPRDFPPLGAYTGADPPGGGDISLAGSNCSKTSTCLTVAAGDYGDVNLSAKGKLTLVGSNDPNNPAVYNFESLMVTGGDALIEVVPPGYIIINIKGNTISPAPVTGLSGCPSDDYGMYLGGQGVTNGTMPPGSFNLNYHGKNCSGIFGGANFAGLMYAPDSSVLLGGNGSIFGSVIGYHTELFGERDIHFDLSLQDERGTLTALQVVSFSRATF